MIPGKASLIDSGFLSKQAEPPLIPPQSAAILLIALTLALSWSVAGRAMSRRRRKVGLMRKAYADLLMDFPWPVCAFDQNGVVAFWNRQCESISGVCAAEIVTNARRTFEVFSAQRHPSRWTGPENFFVLGNCNECRALHWRRLDVNLGIWPLWVVGSYSDFDGNAAESVFSEQRLRLFFDEMGLDITIYDCRRQVVFRHFAALETETAGQVDQFTGDARIDEAIETGRAVSFRRDSGGRMQDVELLPLNADDGRPEYVAAVIRDVTEKHLAERERRLLERHQRQDQKVEALATLAGGMAHDFNNIMATISGYAEIIGYDQDPQGRLGQYAVAINQAAARAKDLVQRVLLFSRSGGAEPRSVAVAPILVETVDGLRAELTPGTALELDLGAGDAMVWADPYQMHLLIRSLCENAIQATSSGVVKVETSICQGASADVPGRCLRLRVSDTGTGMDQATLARIFEPFFTTKDMGRGLGLAMAQGIVSALGGEISVRSQPGAGSVFAAYLPTVASAPEIVTVVEPPRGDGQAVLVFDRQVDVLEEVCGSLQKWGYSVTALSDRLDLFELVGTASMSWSLVLADPGLPQDGAEELTRRLVERCGGTPLVLMSYYVDSFDPFSLKNLGVELLLEKPLDQEKLAEAVKFAFVAH